MIFKVSHVVSNSGEPRRNGKESKSSQPTDFNDSGTSKIYRSPLTYVESQQRYNQYFLRNNAYSSLLKLALWKPLLKVRLQFLPMQMIRRKRCGLELLSLLIGRRRWRFFHGLN